MSNAPVPRRQFLGTSAAALVSATLGTGAAAPPPEPPQPPQHPPTSFSLGVASYSLRNFPRDKAIEMVKALGTPYVNFKSVHLPFELSPEQLAAARREIEAAGLVIVGGGVITFDDDTDPGVEKYFAYAKAAGMPLIAIHTDPKLLPRIERFAKQYDIKVAIHNHGPEDKHFPSPYDALPHVKTLDSRIGLCIDVGHTVRTGTDVVRAIADAGPRLLDMHMKDLRDLTAKGSQCIVGEGAIPIADIFRQLGASGYRGYVNLEYEIDADAPLPGMKQSFAYMRGALAGLAAGERRPHS
ncbi:MAG: sugar phosphate isomerase/epimerase [Gemmatimonadetes bacterium]|nr:MAG: sugar phosphate isomerase/epimerase [Gemmatimonadota bacterium]